MTARICPDCGEEITYRSCQQHGTEAIAELALWVHRTEAHGADMALDIDVFGKAFFQAMDARDARELEP